jgi:two-component system, OmpR family, alkaline phosphatase synthesis response regulator PhoP
MENEYLIYSLEDDKDISKLIGISLKKQGFDVVCFIEPMSFLKAFDQKRPNCVLLDLMLPQMDGKEVLKHIRNNSDNDDVDIIILSAKNSILDKVEGLDLGADDYISKPFDLLELGSRINARKRKHKEKDFIECGNIKINVKRKECYLKDEEIKLSTTEFKILVCLVKNKNQNVSREDLYKIIWNNSAEVESRVVDVHMKSIRKKLHDDNGEIIETLYGFGYKIKD